MEPIEFRCNADGATIPFPHNWEHTIGSDHAAMALRAEYREQLKRCHDELGIGHVRFHGLLSRDMGTLAEHEKELIYSFHNAHSIWDFLLSIGMKPFVELSFMPEPLASGAATVFHYRANVTPPKRYNAWAEFINELVTSAVARYGAKEVSTWPFEVWNEPNLGSFWRGTRKQYFQLYAATARTLKDIHAEIPVGGPSTAKNEWIEEFLDFCEGSDVPVDFVSTHHYPNDEFASSDLDTETQLSASRHRMQKDAPKENRCTTPSGTLHPILVLLCRTSLMQQHSSSRRFSTVTDWLTSTASGRSATFSRRVTSRRCHFMADSGC